VAWKFTVVFPPFNKMRIDEYTLRPRFSTKKSEGGEVREREGDSNVREP
jgi:hypothetical protein